MQALSAPLAGAFFLPGFSADSVEHLAIVFQGILESLHVMKQEPTKSARGIYLPKKIQLQ